MKKFVSASIGIVIGIGLGLAPAMAAAPSSVSCSALAVTITFSTPISGTSADATKIALGAESTGPFRTLSRDSIVEVEDNRTITVLLTSDDVITHDSVTGGTCHVQVQSGFAREVTATTSHRG